MATCVTQARARTDTLPFSLPFSPCLSSFLPSHPLSLPFSHFHVLPFSTDKIVKFLLFGISCFGVINVLAYKVNLIFISTSFALLCALWRPHEISSTNLYIACEEINFTDESLYINLGIYKICLNPSKLILSLLK